MCIREDVCKTRTRREAKTPADSSVLYWGGKVGTAMGAVEEGKERSRYSRRGLLKRAGAGAGAVALSGSVAGAFSRPVRAAPARSQFVSTGSQTFGRLFPTPRGLRAWLVGSAESAAGT